jgi:thymidylate synthase
MAFCYFWLATFAKALNYKTGTIRINISNAHYYLNQQPLVEALLNDNSAPYQRPIVTIDKPLQSLEDILSLEWSDVKISNWTKGPKLTDLSIPMAV